jgi:hypothetical protein
MAISPPRGRVRNSAPSADDDARSAVKRLLALGALALAVCFIIGAFAGIVLFVAGLAALAAHAAAHSHERS